MNEPWTDEQVAEFKRQVAEDERNKGYQFVVLPPNPPVFPLAPEQFDGQIVIEWPEPQGDMLRGWATAISDAETGEPILTVSKMAVRFDAEGIVWAEAEVLADPDGNMLTGKELEIHANPDGGVLTGVFRFQVTEMRAAS